MKTEKLSVVEQFGKNGYEEYRIPSIIITEKGTVLTAYEARQEKGNDWSRVDIAVRRSCDQGRSFEAPVFLPVETEEAMNGKQTWSNPVLIADGEVIHLLFCQNYEKVWYCTSLDEGRSFGLPRDLTGVFKRFPYRWNVCAVGPGHGIVSEKGRLIVPIWLANGEVRTILILPEELKIIFPQRQDAYTAMIMEKRGKQDLLRRELKMPMRRLQQRWKMVKYCSISGMKDMRNAE